MILIKKFHSLASKYDAFLLDLWGVVHDGTALYAGARECLQQLYAQNKQVLLISNAPRRASKAQAVLDQLGVGRDLYQHIITSGEVAYMALQTGVCHCERPEGARQSKASLNEKKWIASSHDAPRDDGKAYYFIGPDRDADVLDGLDFKRVPRVQDADFLLNVGFGSEQDSVAGVMAQLQEAKSRELSMLCLNPDMEVVKITGEVFECAGVIAKQYVDMGGVVDYFGKPYEDIYMHAHALVGYTEKAKILAVGDGLYTDIQGANAFGVDSLLISGGILKGRVPNDLQPSATPTFVMPEWVW